MSFEDEIWDKISQEMQLGICSAKHDFHAFCVANVSGLSPQARTVILRNFDPLKRYICFHTDARSPKYEQLKANPRVMSIFYSGTIKMQLRFNANATVHHLDDLSAKHWLKTTPQSRRTYLKIHPPGKIIGKDSAILDPEFLYSTPNDHQSNCGLANFAVVKLLFDSVEVLLLNSCGNQCVKLEWKNQKRIFHYLAP